MADTRVPVADTKPVSPVAHGIAVFAGVIMIVAGAFQAIEGLAGIVNDEYLVVLPNYFLAFDITLWGWLHLLIGLALLAIGVVGAEGCNVGSRRRHDPRGNIGAPQLHLVAVFALVVAHGHRH